MIFFLTLFLSLFAHADSKLQCLYNGQSVDIYDNSQKKTFNGKVSCTRDFGDSKQVEEYEFKDGHKLSERLKGNGHNFLRHYGLLNGNEVLDGESLEYYGQGDKIRSRQNYKMMHEEGLQLEYYESGAVKAKKFYFRADANSGPRQTASIEFLENGSVRYLNCAEKEAHTLEPALCGFSQESTVPLFYESGAKRGSQTFKNGIKIREEFLDPQHSSVSRLLANAFVKTKKPSARVTVEYASDKSEKITEYFEGNIVKRKIFLNSEGHLSGEESENFPEGKLARKTVWSVVDEGNRKVTRFESGDCYWQNGEPRAEIRRSGKSLAVKYFWDTGKPKEVSTYSREAAKGHQIYPVHSNDSDFCEYVNNYLLDGEHKEFARDGLPTRENHFQLGVLEGLEKTFNEKGILEMERVYEKGKVISEKKFQGSSTQTEEFNEDGSVKKTRQ